MPGLHFPWLEMSVLIPLFGALGLAWLKPSRQTARAVGIVIATLALGCTLTEWIDFLKLGAFEAHDQWSFFGVPYLTDVLMIDELSAPLIPLASLIFLIVILATLSDKVQRFSFSRTLFSEAIVLATFSCCASWMLVFLLCLATIPPWLELRQRGRCTRVFTLHMGAFVTLLVVGWGGYSVAGPDRGIWTLIAGALVTGGVLVRSGIAPLHCWMTDLFEKASFGTAILFVTPLTGAYAVMRLVLPIAPAWALQSIAAISLVTALYAAAMALIQTEARRYYCYLLLSNSSLVLVGLKLVTPIGLTGALCVWLSVMLCMTGFAITLRSIETRIGRVWLGGFHGLYRQFPSLAGFFLLTGLASIGFPATIGFVGLELLVEGAVEVYPVVGTLVVIVAAFNGIGMLNAYFRIFTGCRDVATIHMPACRGEKIAILLLSGLILGGGILPQPGVHGRYHAARQLSEILPEQGKPVVSLARRFFGSYSQQHHVAQ